MILIKKLFIKNYNDTGNEKVRNAYGLVAGIFGIITNLVLFISKFIIGIITGSMSIIADSVNNLSDMASSFITVFGFVLSSKPADRTHPYGHHRIEYISSMMIAIVMIIIGVTLSESSVSKIISNTPVIVNMLTFIILIISVLLKLFQMILYISFGKSISSETLILSGKESRNDIITTIVVILSSLVICLFGNLPFSIDGVSGLIVSVFIIISSIGLLRETINPLLGEKPDEELLKEMRDFISSYDGVYGVHDLMVHNYGANTNFTIAHVEVSGSEDVVSVHDIIDKIERDFRKKFSGELTIHIDPIELDNAELNNLRFRINDILKSINTNFEFHDLQLVKNNLMFDIVVPFEVQIDKKQIMKCLSSELNKGKHRYNVIVDFDRK